MMMRCLIEGGLDGIYDTNIDNTIFQDDYHPNPNGFYQNTVDEKDILEYENKLTKFPYRSLLLLPEANYKVLFIKRNPIEIYNSMISFTPFQSWGKDMVVLEFYEEIIGFILSELKKRSDIDLIVLNYSDIVKDPINSFKKLSDNGWPIDIYKCADLVDDSLYRLKLEKDGK